MKAYLAAKFSRREELELGVVPYLTAALKDFSCTARWVFGGEDGLSRSEVAELDLDDVDKADTIILFTHERSSPQPGGGRFVEFGYALGKGKRCIVIGPAENVFMFSDRVEIYESLTELVEHDTNTVSTPENLHWWQSQKP